MAPSIALIVLAVVASALPGSPVRSWFSQALGGTQKTATVLEGWEQQGAFERPPSGVSVLPSGDFELVFEKVQDSGVIRISLADQPEVSVHSDSGEVGYSVEPQGVTVLNSGSVANYQLALPERAKSITIRVGDRIIFYKQEAAIEISVAQDAEGHSVVEFRSLSR